MIGFRNTNFGRNLASSTDFLFSRSYSRWETEKKSVLFFTIWWNVIYYTHGSPWEKMAINAHDDNYTVHYFFSDVGRQIYYTHALLFVSVKNANSLRRKPRAENSRANSGKRAWHRFRRGEKEILPKTIWVRWKRSPLLRPFFSERTLNPNWIIMPYVRTIFPRQKVLSFSSLIRDSLAPRLVLFFRVRL